MSGKSKNYGTVIRQMDLKVKKVQLRPKRENFKRTERGRKRERKKDQRRRLTITHTRVWERDGERRRGKIWREKGGFLRNKYTQADRRDQETRTRPSCTWTGWGKQGRFQAYNSFFPHGQTTRRAHRLHTSKQHKETQDCLVKSQALEDSQLCDWPTREHRQINGNSALIPSPQQSLRCDELWTPLG